MSTVHDYAHGVVGRDPLGKTITNLMVGNHPDWPDEQIADRINCNYEEPVITVDEVAHWRAEMQA